MRLRVRLKAPGCPLRRPLPEQSCPPAPQTEPRRPRPTGSHGPEILLQLQAGARAEPVSWRTLWTRVAQLPGEGHAQVSPTCRTAALAFSCLAVSEDPAWPGVCARGAGPWGSCCSGGGAGWGDRAWTEHVGQSHGVPEGARGAGRWERAAVLDQVVRRDVSEVLKGTRGWQGPGARVSGKVWWRWACSRGWREDRWHRRWRRGGWIAGVRQAAGTPGSGPQPRRPAEGSEHRTAAMAARGRGTRTSPEEELQVSVGATRPAWGWACRGGVELGFA